MPGRGPELQQTCGRHECQPGILTDLRNNRDDELYIPISVLCCRFPLPGILPDWSKFRADRIYIFNFCGQVSMSNHLRAQCKTTRFLEILLRWNIYVELWKAQMLESVCMCSHPPSRCTFDTASAYRRAILSLDNGCCFLHVSSLLHSILSLLLAS